MVKPAKHWTPSRKEVIWMDCNPQVGREMKDMHPFLVFCHQPKSFDWRARRAKPHPLGMLEQSLFRVVCERLNQIVMLNQ